MSLHGGGWYQPSLYYGLQCYLPAALNAGYAVVAAEYRAGAEGWRGKDMVQDILDLIQFIQKKGTLHGLDPSRIVIMGCSAGAHIGTIASYLANAAAQKLVVSAVVARYGAVGSLAKAHEEPSLLPRGFRDLVRGGEARSSRGWRERNAIEHITGMSPALQGTSSASIVSTPKNSWASFSTSSSAAVETTPLHHSIQWERSRTRIRLHQYDYLSAISHIGPYTPPTLLLHCSHDEFYNAKIHSDALAAVLGEKGVPNLYIRPRMYSMGVHRLHRATQFLRYSFLELLAAVAAKSR